jgi:hypothetical protein
MQVHMVISQTNMWANIQRAAAPWAISWQLDDAADWLPFFSIDTVQERHLGTLQPPVRC